MKRILTSIALIASLGTAQAAGPEDVLLGLIIGGVIGNAIAKDHSHPQPQVYQHPQVIYQPQPQVIYQPIPPQPQCYHTPIYNGYGQFIAWRTNCR